jgi:hypothetical protein
VSRLRVRSVDFITVAFDLVSDEDGSLLRPVVVRVGSGPSWYDAVRFPTFGSDATASTGNARLDRAIRDRAAAELVRLEAAQRAGSVA